MHCPNCGDMVAFSDIDFSYLDKTDEIARQFVEAFKGLDRIASVRGMPIDTVAILERIQEAIEYRLKYKVW